MGGRTCVASWVALSTPVLFFCYFLKFVFRRKEDFSQKKSSTKYFRTMSSVDKDFSTKTFGAKDNLDGHFSVKNSFRTRSFNYLFLFSFLILSLIKFTRIKMFLQGELFCNTRRHKYSYIFIWTLPRFPSLHFPKENCVPANIIL